MYVDIVNGFAIFSFFGEIEIYIHIGIYAMVLQILMACHGICILFFVATLTDMQFL